MLIEQVKRLSALDRLIYWIKERESIRLKKEAGEPKPWTTDDILQNYRFCCVRRADDKVSKWLYTNWYKPHYNHPNMLVACCLARHINLPATLGMIGFPDKWQPSYIKVVVRNIRAEGGTAYNGAYIVRGIGTADKIEMVVDRVCTPLLKNPPSLDTSSMEACVNALLPYWGLSDFMAGQLVADLRWAMQGTWTDRKTWAAIGPGSRRGMNRLHGRPVKAPLKQVQFTEELRALIKVLAKKLPASIFNRLEAIDAQNCLCEYWKLERALFFDQMPKQRYPGAE